jgi:hypothetical protein
MSHDCDLDGSPDDPNEFIQLDVVVKIALLATNYRTLAINANVLRNSLTQQEQSLRPQCALTARAPDDNQSFR